METTTAAWDSDGDIKQKHIQQTEIRTTIRDASIAGFSESSDTQLE
jgi:hypothetical protein